MIHPGTPAVMFFFSDGEGSGQAGLMASEKSSHNNVRNMERQKQRLLGTTSGYE